MRHVVSVARLVSPLKAERASRAVSEPRRSSTITAKSEIGLVKFCFIPEPYPCKRMASQMPHFDGWRERLGSRNRVTHTGTARHTGLIDARGCRMPVWLTNSKKRLGCTNSKRRYSAGIG